MTHLSHAGYAVELTQEQADDVFLGGEGRVGFSKSAEGEEFTVNVTDPDSIEQLDQLYDLTNVYVEKVGLVRRPAGRTTQGGERRPTFFFYAKSEDYDEIDGGDSMGPKKYNAYDFEMTERGAVSPFLSMVDEEFAENRGKMSYADCLETVSRNSPDALFLHDCWSAAWSAGKPDPLPQWLQGRFLSCHSEWFAEVEGETVSFGDFDLAEAVQQYAEELGESGMDAASALAEARAQMGELFGSQPSEAAKSERLGRDEKLVVLRRIVADILEAELERGESLSNPELPFRLQRESAYARPDLLSSLGQGVWERTVKGVIDGWR